MLLSPPMGVELVAPPRARNFLSCEITVNKLLGAVCLIVACLGLAGCAAPGTEHYPPSDTKYVSPKKEATQPLVYEGSLAVLRGA